MNGININVIVMLVVWVAIFYFMLILPNKKRQKKQQEMLNSLKEGVEVITAGGIKGTIVNITPDFISIRIDKGVHMQVLKSSISRVVK